MSKYLGFEPSDKPYYFFISYNSEDAERVGVIARRLAHADVPIWYDHGINYGDEWETVISEKLAGAQAVVLFFTKDILEKKNSYVYKEYVMATEYFDKPVYVVIMDAITNKEVPPARVPWWIDIQRKQCINIAGVSDLDKISREILKAIGMESHEDKMNQMIKQYKSLYDFGKADEAESYLSEYLRSESLAGKAKCIANMMSGKIEGLNVPTCAQDLGFHIDVPVKDHMGNDATSFVECQKLTVNGDAFHFGNSCIFHRGMLGDAHLINIWKNGENIYTLGGLIEASDMKIHYDSLDDIIYLSYRSERETRQGGEVLVESFVSIITIEDPCGRAVCTSFKWLVKVGEYTA